MSQNTIDILSLLYPDKTLNNIETELFQKYNIDLSSIFKEFSYDFPAYIMNILDKHKVPYKSPSDSVLQFCNNMELSQDYFCISSIFLYCFDKVIKTEATFDATPDFIKQKFKPSIFDHNLFLFPCTYDVGSLEQRLFIHSTFISYYSLLDLQYSEKHMHFTDNAYYKNYKKRIKSINNKIPIDFLNTKIGQHPSTGIFYREFLHKFDEILLQTHAELNKASTFFNKKDLSNAQVKHLNQMIRNNFFSLVNYYENIYKICIDTQTSELERSLYYFKLEALFGVNLLIESLYATNNFNLKIEDWKYFQPISYIFERDIIPHLYTDKDYSLSEITYINERLFPLVTNTFFVLVQKLYSTNTLNALSRFFEYCFNKNKKPKADSDFIPNKFISYSLFPPYYIWSAMYPKHHNFRPIYFWYDKTFLTLLIENFITTASPEQKHHLLEYFYSLFQKETWHIPSSRLP